MEKKKLIGTIIGVIFFVALIAGATFAWLTFNATVTNGNYNTGSRNFVINYTDNGDISSAKILNITTAAGVTDSAIGNYTIITAALNSATTPHGTLTLTLNTGTDTASQTVRSAIRYSVATCTGAATCTDFGTPTAPQSVSSNTQVLTLPGGGTTASITSNTVFTRFKVYVWLDAESVGESMVGKSYTGHISATATQTEN